jgi:hypothetical protein
MPDMKAWTNRSKRDKAARIVLSLAVLGFAAYGAPHAVVEVYDYYTADSCKQALVTEIQAGIADNTKISSLISDVQSAAAAYAASARHFAQTIAAIRCPLSIAGAQAELVAALEGYADVQEANAKTGTVSTEVRGAATVKVVDALEKLQALIG